MWSEFWSTMALPMVRPGFAPNGVLPIRFTAVCSASRMAVPHRLEIRAWSTLWEQ